MIALFALVFTGLSAPSYAEDAAEPGAVSHERGTGTATAGEDAAEDAADPTDPVDAGTTRDGTDAADGAAGSSEQAPDRPAPGIDDDAAPVDDADAESKDEPAPPVLDLPVARQSEQGLESRQSDATNSTASARYANGLISQKVRLADARDDIVPPTQQQRLTRIDVTRDLVERTITAKATFAQTPTTSLDSVVYVYLGTWSGNSCLARVGLGATAVGASAAGAFLDGNGGTEGSLTVTRSRSKNVLTLTSRAHAKIRSSNWNCAYGLNQSTGGSPNYTAFYAESLQDVFKPKLALDLGKPLQGNYRGKTTKVRVTIRNSGEGDARSVRLKASGKGLSIKKKSRGLGTIKAGRSKTVTFNVKVKSGKQRSFKTTATASGGAKSAKSVKIVVKPKKTKYRSLSGRYFWGFLPSSLSDYQGWNNRAVWFLNKKWAYVGFPKSGKKPRCGKSSKSCKRYSYNKRTGVAKIGAQKFKVTSEGFRYRAKKGEAKAYFEPLTLPKKGARLSAKLLRHDWTGYCMLTCTATTERLVLGKNRKFVWSRSSVGSWPGLGSSWAIIPADQRGTYRVISKGRIELRYSNGKKKRHTIGIMHDIRGKASPSEGVMIGDTNFYRE
ncbi:hypothetical protein J4H92_00240 [Leucobacter weissii]|uniref:CARDB domain-containing protein n=1 Tax=Leucobacter weissii TaxID=1983706 RepID=A0A939MGV8_9MICO|nr:CARDB domain-containing protein [Leucobacter weissii]MBO1900376.1 hypothetical protein [Leucobacter weissii]